MVFHVISTCTGWIVVLVLPIPSTVVTAIPSTAHNGSKQPFAEKCMENVKDNRKKNDTLTRTFGYIKNNSLFQKKNIFKFIVYNRLFQPLDVLLNNIYIYIYIYSVICTLY